MRAIFEVIVFLVLIFGAIAAPYFLPLKEDEIFSLLVMIALPLLIIFWRAYMDRDL